MLTLEQTIGHYHESFTSIDTVKLRILLNIKAQELGFAEIKVKDGCCTVGGEKVLPLGNVAEFLNSRTLQQLKAELAEVEEQYFRMKPQYETRKNDEDFYRAYSEIATKRQNLLDTIGELQDAIFQMSLNMSADDVHGEVSPRQKEAYRLFEQGDYEGALRILDAQEIDDEFEADMHRMEQMQQARAAKYIKEHKTAIDILMTMYDYKGRFDEIERRYKKIVPVAEKYNVELDVVYDYICYLQNQTLYSQAIRLAERLLTNEAFCADSGDKLQLLNLLALLHDINNHTNQAEKYFQEALCLRKTLADTDPELYNSYVQPILNYAKLCFEKGELKKAESYYEEVLVIANKLKEKGLQADYPALSYIYLHTGDFYKELGKEEEAKKLLHKALEYSSLLAKEDPDKFNPVLAHIYNQLAQLVKTTTEEGKNEKEKYLSDSLRLFQEAAAKNPQQYDMFVALLDLNLGLFYYALCPDQFDKAESLFKNAERIYLGLAKENPEAFNSNLSNTYSNLAALYMSVNRTKDAENYLHRALDCCKIYKYTKAYKYSSSLANINFRLSRLYRLTDRSPEEEGALEKMLELFRSLAGKNPDGYNPILAIACSLLAITYEENHKRKKAKVLFAEAEQIASRYPDNPYCVDILRQLEERKADKKRDKPLTKSQKIIAIIVIIMLIALLVFEYTFGFKYILEFAQKIKESVFPLMIAFISSQ